MRSELGHEFKLSLCQKNQDSDWLTMTLLVYRDLHDPFFSDLRSDPDPFVKSGSTIRSDPFTLLRKGSTIRYFQILFDPFRSDPYHVYLRIQFHKSCVF